jgi:hypothetical protein
MLSLTSCDQAFYDKQQQESKIAQMRDALEVALEANLKYREADVNCGWFNSNWLFVTLYAKSTDKMPRQHTSNPKIPKVSKAIGSPFY